MLKRYGADYDDMTEMTHGDYVYYDDYAALERELTELREAVTPSSATKAAYMGEFSIRFPEFDENGDEYVRSINVPWITIKDIMKAIRVFAKLEEK